MILDVGCGKNKRGDIGIDPSRDSYANVIADAEFLPFMDCSFDVVKSVNLLEHVPNPLNCVKEQYRVLKSYGKVELITDNAQYFRWSVLGMFGIIKHEHHPEHYEIFFPGNVIKLLKRAGFLQTDYRYLKIPKTKLHILFRFLVMIKFFRKESLYNLFSVTGIKPRES
jgi:SAM-dependent methyltransferase